MSSPDAAMVLFVVAFVLLADLLRLVEVVVDVALCVVQLLRDLLLTTRQLIRGRSVFRLYRPGIFGRRCISCWTAPRLGQPSHLFPAGSSLS